MKRLGLCLAASLALVSCGDSAEEAEERNEDATARGEVLGGTISDDMLPLDTVRSQSPPRSGEGENGGGNGSSGETAPESSQDVEEAPAPEPQPEQAAEAQPEAEPAE